jgi:NAD-dependent SIR2 family protein deacetylase
MELGDVGETSRLDEPQLDGPLLECTRCNAVWREDVAAEGTRRDPTCPLCEGPLRPVP